MTTSVIVVAYRTGGALVRCLESLAPDCQGPLEAVVVDNGGGGAEIEAAARLPWVRIVDAGENLGYAAGSNLGARTATGEMLVFLNPDAVAAPGAVPELVSALADDRVGIATARLLQLERPDVLNTGGNVLHLCGLAWVGGHGRPKETASRPRELAFPTGAAMAVRADVFRAVGGFTDELFLYHEDVDLGWRTRLSGRRVVLVPTADVLHDYEFGRNPRKNYFLERNRLVFLAASYSGRLLAVLAPVLVSAELGLVVLAAREGWLREKVAGWRWCLRHRSWIRRHRAATQRLRRVPDRELARLLTPVIDPAVIAVPKPVRLANPVLEAYWALARRAL